MPKKRHNQMEKNDNANGKINIFMYPSVWLQVPSNIKIASVYTQYYTDVCVCVSMAAGIAEGKLAPANGRNPGREQLLFALSWSQKWGQKPAPKTGPHYCWKKEKLPKWRPPQ